MAKVPIQTKTDQGLARRSARGPTGTLAGSSSARGLTGAEGMLQLEGWTRARRLIFAVACKAGMRGVLGPDQARVCRLCPQPRGGLQDYNAWQIQQLCRDRGDVENVFDELKNQWGFSGFCAKRRRPPNLPRVCSCWSTTSGMLFARFIVPHKHLYPLS